MKEEIIEGVKFINGMPYVVYDDDYRKRWAEYFAERRAKLTNPTPVKCSECDVEPIISISECPKIFAAHFLFDRFVMECPQCKKFVAENAGISHRKEQMDKCKIPEDKEDAELRSKEYREELINKWNELNNE